MKNIQTTTAKPATLWQSFRNWLTPYTLDLQETPTSAGLQTGAEKDEEGKKQPARDEQMEMYSYLYLYWFL